MNTEEKQEFIKRVANPMSMYSHNAMVKLARRIYDNKSNPSTYNDLTRAFGKGRMSKKEMTVALLTLINEGIVETVQIGGRSIWDLKKEFRTEIDLIKEPDYLS